MHLVITEKAGANDLIHLDCKQQDPLWKTRQADVAAAFRHAWKGYKTFAMGFDELQPLSKHGVDGLGGLGATVIDALDTAMIMGLSDIVKDAGSWIKKELPNRLNEKGQVVTLNSYLCLSCLRDTSETRSWQIADT